MFSTAINFINSVICKKKIYFMKEKFVIKVQNDFFFFQAQTFSFVFDSSDQWVPVHDSP